MYRNALRFIALVSFCLVFSSCVTTTEPAVAENPPITVEGTMFYPDDANQTYVVPNGAEIIGAGGANCKFIVEAGGRMTAHSGTNNVYIVKNGGAFKGFDHPATNCQVRFQSEASVEQDQGGEGVQFIPVN